MKTTHDLLNDYCQTRSEAAFRELVERYIGLVYSSALRLLNGDTHLAEDVTQLVFVDLSRSACSLSKQVALGGWLHQRTFHVTAPLIRSNRRRQAREKAAMENEAVQNPVNNELTQFTPVLDEAINALSSEDRMAIVMRFFEQQSLNSVGLALGITDDAAQKRVSRALEKLHVLLRKRGVTLALPALASSLTADSLSAAPAGLASSIASGVLAGSVPGGVLVSNLVKTITMMKLKMGVLGAVLVLAGGTLAFQLNRTNERLRTENERLRSQPLNYTNPVFLGSMGLTSAVSNKTEGKLNEAELLRLRGQLARTTLELQALQSNRATQSRMAAMLLHPMDLSQFPDAYVQIKASMATNAGIATPNALLQTWLWALRTGDLDGLYSTCDWPDGTPDKKKLEDVTLNASAAQHRHQSDSFEDYKLKALWDLGDDFYLGVFDESGNPAAWSKTISGKQFFHKTQDGWKITNYVPPQGAFLSENGKWRQDFQAEVGSR